MTTTAFTGREGMSRRRVLGAALAAGVALPIGVARQAWAAPVTPAPARVTLPPPTGRYLLGTVAPDKARIV
jgi:hypothetical protein